MHASAVRFTAFTKSARSLRWLAVLSQLLFSACTVKVFSPPSGAPPMESSATIGKGRHAVRGDIQGGSGGFGPTLASYRLSVARGITEQLDVSLAASAVRIRAPEPGNPHGGIYTLRAGVKYAPVRFVALSYGLAPGGSVGGSFLAQDAGLTLGGENPYLVPFTAVHGLLSTPLRARTVRILYTDDNDDDAPPSEQGPDVYLEKPRLTWGWQLLLGLKLPLWRDPAFRAVPAPRVRPSFTCAAGVTALSTKRAGDLYFTSGCAVEVTF